MKKFNTIRKLQLLSILSFIIAFSACKNQNAPLSKTDLLTDKQWKISTFSIDPGFPIMDENLNITGYTTDMFTILGMCIKDDTYKFNVNKVVSIDGGALKCDSSEPQTVNGTWNFNQGETILTMNLDGGSLDQTIVELTADLLKVNYTETDIGKTYTLTITYLH